MGNEDMYELRVVFRVNIKKWRIDDQSDVDNREWNAVVYDRNLQKWVNVSELNRPGEKAYIESIERI